MKRGYLLSVAAISAIALLAGCNRNAANTSGGTEANNTAAATATDNTAGANATGNATGANTTGGVGQTKPVNDVQDAASAPVGMASATTLGSHDTGAFVTNAAISDMYEIQAAKLAEQKSQNPAVKAFARKMIHDHTQTSEQLKGLVSKGAVQAQLPTGLDQRRNGLLDNLKASQGKDFDTRYANQQVAAHREAVAMFNGYAKNGDNPQLKKWAATTAPKLQGHLDMAQQMLTSAGGEGAGGAAPGQ